MLYEAKKSFELMGNLLGRLPNYELSHMLRVGIMVKTLASKLTRFDIKKANMFGEAACYHDVGKVFVPQQILVKSGKLTSIERNLMKMHCVTGQIALSQISKYDSYVCDNLWQVTEAALFHHEHWDGNGYPFGLVGIQIPVVGRLVAICDAYDAITSTRPYSRGREHAQACKELERCSGFQFDPKLVDVFLHNSVEMKSVVNDLEDEWKQSIYINQRMQI